MEGIRLDAKTVIITGANTGIGKETARELARKGARVILACRNREKAEEARDDIIQDTGNNNVVVKILDLASFKSIRDFAQDINTTEERIDILVENAGVFTKKRAETQEGFEMMFGVNHLGHFLLTHLLLDKIKASAPSRLVIVSSLGHKFSKMSFKDPQYERGFKNMLGYCRSKTANILFGVQLAKNLQGTGVTVYSLHPGAVDTELPRDYDQNGCLMKTFRALAKMSGNKYISAEDGAKTSLYCCLEPSIAEHSGRYYDKSKEARAKGYATNEGNAQKLWDLSLQLCQL